jgi:hypothetical protein
VTAPARQAPPPASPVRAVGLPNLFAPVGAVIAQAVAELLHELQRAGLTVTSPPPRPCRPVTVEITVDRDSEGDLLWRATLKVRAVGWAERYDDTPGLAHRPNPWRPATLFDHVDPARPHGGPHRAVTP